MRLGSRCHMAAYVTHVARRVNSFHRVAFNPWLGAPVYLHLRSEA